MMEKGTSGLVIEQPKPIRKQVYEHLRKQILNQAILPSSRLVEAQIAKELGISRTPVREALHLLEKDGFVESIPRVGYRVKRLEWDELEEIFEIRRVNETLVCRWALQNIDAETLRDMEANIALTESALKKDDPELFLKCDEEFHESLGRAAGSRHLFELCQQLRRLMMRYRAESFKTTASIKNVLDGHRRMVQCLKDKDEDGLVAALIEHLEWSKEDIREKALKLRGDR
ncbi:MAG: GntR family transcriptional regulator [Desulfobacteraceae bacterium]|jgi:DNA-binding GntR family transcriptional regulator